MPATQVEPVVSRVRSYQPPVPFFDETQAQYQERLRANSNANAEAGPSRIRAEEKIVAGERAAGPEAEEAQPETQLIDCESSGGMSREKGTLKCLPSRRFAAVAPS